MAPRDITTKFPSRCMCGHQVQAGARVRYDSQAQPRIRECPSCRAPAPDAAPEPTVPAAAFGLRVKVQRIRHESPDGSFAVAEVTLDDDQLDTCPVDLPVERDVAFGCVGPLGKIQVADLLTVYGRFEPSKWGLQFKTIRAVRTVGSTLQSLRAFLAGLPHIGQSRAKAIIEHIGDRKAVLHAIEHEPLRLAEVNGITEERALAIQKAYLAEGELREIDEWLAGLEVGEGTRASILDKWAKDAKWYLEEDPYRLMELRGFGFKKADELATSRFGIRSDDPRRAAAAIIHLLEEEENEGHTFAVLSDLIGRT